MSAAERASAGWRGLAGMLLMGLASMCVAQPALQPFTTDGCSLFPDRALVGRADWCHCCVAHDIAYWRGGTADARREADRELQTCVLKASNDKALADLMLAGVRTGGGPYFNTPYRWAYGWPYGRTYQALTPQEQALAASLEGEYRTKNPTLACPAAEVTVR